VIARRKPLATPYDMSAYIIVEIEITDPVGYEEYKKLAGPTVEQYGGKYIVRSGACEMLEGDWKPKRIVILQFENVERAKAWLNCPEYAEPRKMRHRTAKTRWSKPSAPPATPKKTSSYHRALHRRDRKIHPRLSRAMDLEPSPLENQTIRPTQPLLEGIWCSSLQLLTRGAQATCLPVLAASRNDISVGKLGW